jgi:hypothetical protein
MAEWGLLFWSCSSVLPADRVPAMTAPPFD